MPKKIVTSDSQKIPFSGNLLFSRSLRKSWFYWINTKCSKNSERKRCDWCRRRQVDDGKEKNWTESLEQWAEPMESGKGRAFLTEIKKNNTVKDAKEPNCQRWIELICLNQCFSEHMPQSTGSTTCSIKKIKYRDGEFCVRTRPRDAVCPHRSPGALVQVKGANSSRNEDALFFGHLKMQKLFLAEGPCRNHLIFSSFQITTSSFFCDFFFT